MISSSEQNLFGLPVDREILFSNHKGTYKKGIEKSQTKLTEKISYIKPPPLPFLTLQYTDL